jgi:hypothetical protein
VVLSDDSTRPEAPFPKSGRRLLKDTALFVTGILMLTVAVLTLVAIDSANQRLVDQGVWDQAWLFAVAIRCATPEVNSGL